MKTATVTLLSVLAALPVLAGGTPRTTDSTSETVPAVNRVSTVQSSATPDVCLSDLMPQPLQAGLRSEPNWTDWSYVSGSTDLMYRSADDPARGGCGYIEFRGPARKTYHVAVYTHVHGNNHSTKQTLNININFDGHYGTRTYDACIDPDSASLAD